MKKRVSLIGCVAVSLMAALSGCVVKESVVNEDLTVAEAKSVTQSVEVRIAESVPSSVRGPISQKETGVFLSCGKGGHSWTGSLRASIEADPEPGEVLDPIVDEFRDDPGFQVARWQDQGDELVDVASDDGALWITRYRRAAGEIVVHSFSACFRLPDGIWPGDHY